MSASLIDRELQKRLLQHLAETFPQPRAVELPIEERTRDVNLSYLEEHGLVQRSISKIAQVKIDHGWRITAEGVDFLRDDGGLSAILGVVMIRLHDDTILSILESRITASNLPQPEKSRFVAQLRSLPADATRHLVLKLMDQALDHWPDALRLLQTTLHFHG